MNKTVLSALLELEDRLVVADALGDSFGDLGGDSVPAWVLVYRDQVKSILLATEALGALLRGKGGDA